MGLTPQQAQFTKQIEQLARDSWDAGWKAACEEFTKIATERDDATAIAAMRKYL